MPDDFTNDRPTYVKLGDVKSDGTPDIANVLFEFPAPYGQMRVRQEVRIDDVEAPGRSGKIKQAVGYQDSEISIGLRLFSDDDDTALEKYAVLQDAFRKRDNADSLPRVFSIQSPLTDACRIQTVLFKGLEISDSEGTDQLEVTVSLTEFEPIEAAVDDRGGSGGGSGGGGSGDGGGGGSGGSGSGSGSGGGNPDASGADDAAGHSQEDSAMRDAFNAGKRDAMGGSGPGRPGAE
ncbi:MAG: hypothetical protein KJZ87_02435 [Thermoguttaceae bacterium]|nr:hypothetical protein [Thermoguttaceae bacterium]